MKIPRALLLSLCAATGVAGAADADMPCPPEPAASQLAATKPAKVTDQTAANVASMKDDRAEGTVQPQLAVPLRRGMPPDPTALKPGRQHGKGSGELNDGAARCQATRSQ